MLIAANLVATVIRFLLYRYWVFGTPKRTTANWSPGRGPVTGSTPGMSGHARRDDQVSATTTIPRHAAGSRPRPAGRRFRRLAGRPGHRSPLGPPGHVRAAGATAVLYLWNLTRNGWANDFYAAAVHAGTKSWKAFFFGSFDSAQLHHRGQAPRLAVGHGDIGADLRLQLVVHAGAAGARGCASVGLLYAAVRRWFGPAPG